MSRVIAVGDIHGCSRAFESILSQINPGPEDTLVTLGDYVDRGPDSKGVLDQLIALSRRCHLVPLLGNHDELMLDAIQTGDEHGFWFGRWGKAALESYGAPARLNLVPESHVEFLRSCRTYYETERHLFFHANYRPGVLAGEADGKTARWLSLRDYVPDEPHVSGKVVVVGHTPQLEILNLGYLICIDTGCCNGGKLSALDVNSGRVWEAVE